jgi:hypothetical protein
VVRFGWGFGLLVVLFVAFFCCSFVPPLAFLMPWEVINKFAIQKKKSVLRVWKCLPRVQKCFNFIISNSHFCNFVFDKYSERLLWHSWGSLQGSTRRFLHFGKVKQIISGDGHLGPAFGMYGILLGNRKISTLFFIVLVHLV